MLLTRGTTVGRYRVTSPIGRGAMGEIYLAFDTQLERPAALKILTSELAFETYFLERFAREARAASALNHPNILTVFEVGEVSGVPFIATEFVSGRTLRDRLDEDNLSLEEILDLAIQAASALAAAHEAGVIHRDIKPENLMVRTDGVLKVVDFGLAKLKSFADPADAAASLSETGTVLGTAHYMPPEQARGLEVDARGDVWSLGVVLYEMLSGSRPYEGGSAVEVMLKVVTAEHAPIASLRPDLPASITRIVDLALAKSAADRYRSAHAMGADLRRERDDLLVERVRAARERPPTPTNLTEESRPLVGREADLRALVAALVRDDVRLLSMTGPGGTGKTRLARAVGLGVLDDFADGVFFVDLAPVRDTAHVASAIALAAGVKEAAATPLADVLVAGLRGRKVLLVLDNFEQLLESASLVGRLISDAAPLKVLVTSQAPLRLREELEYPLAPLDLPDETDASPADEATKCGAVALFVERARATGSGFTLTEENVETVVEICRRLDGLPLAIELAASRVRVLSPAALLSRLEDALKLLVGGARDLPERQRTMRGAIVWSYDLLEPDERRLFERLSVFAGGCTLETAESVGSIDWEFDSEVLDTVESLVEKSLLIRRVAANGEPRFRMLEVVRAFALERLRERGELDTVRRRHAEVYLDLAEAMERESVATMSNDGFERLAVDHDNLRAALGWSLAEGDAPELALRLAAAMGLFWSVRGHWNEGRSWLDRALAAAPDAPLRSRAAALLVDGILARLQTDLDRACELLERSVALSRELDDRFGTAEALEALGVAQSRGGRHAAAEASLREALTLYEARGDDRGRAKVFGSLGYLAYERRDTESVVSYCEQALAIFRRLGHRRKVAAELYNLGVIANNAKQFERATELLEEALAIAIDFDERPLVARVSHYLGNAAAARGDRVRAAELRGSAARDYVALGDTNMWHQLLDDLCDDAVAREDPRRIAHLVEATLGGQERGDLVRRTANEPQDAGMVWLRKTVGDAATDRLMSDATSTTLADVVRLIDEDL